MQARVRVEFGKVAQEVMTRYGASRWVEIDASGTIDDVGTILWDSVKAIVDMDLGQVGRLWQN